MNIKSYNCHGPRKDEMIEIVDDCDIVLIQETWLAKQELAIINDIHVKYLGFDRAKCDYSSGRKSGGTAILWKSLDEFITSIDIPYDWCCGVTVKADERVIAIINVYLPYHSNDKEEEYTSDLSAINTIVDDLNCTSVLIIGDWDADASNPRSWFYKYLMGFCTDNGFVWSSGQHLPDDTYTYVSEAWGSTSWLDHCVSTEDGNNIVTCMGVVYDCNLSDHFVLNIFGTGPKS